MDNPTPLKAPTEADVRAFVYDWFRKLDVHAPLEELLPALAEKRLEMLFPESTMTSREAFSAWYPGVLNLFFDEVHELKRIDVTMAAGSEWRADVSIIVKWEARRWKPPAAKSDYLGFDAWQRWVLTLDPKTGKPWIQRYIVDILEPLQGSAPL